MTRLLVGSSWRGGGPAAVIVRPPDPDPGDPPTDPEGPGDPPVDPPVTGLVSRLLPRCHALWHHGEMSGVAIPDLKGSFPGTITTGQTIRSQPPLVIGDDYNSTLYVNGYSTVPGDLAQARPDGGGVIGVFQFQPSARWMSLINRFGDAWSNPGGFAIAIAYTGGEYKLRGQLHDGTSSILLEAATALVPGTSYAAALIWGPDGLRLFLGNETSQALIGSNATMVGSQGAYPIVIGADRAGASRFAGAIDLVALYDGQPSEASVLLDLAEVKAGVVWTNDGAITLQASTTGVFDPRPTALVDSTTPTAVVTVQPSNATATAQADGTITIEAGETPGSSTNGRYTLDGSNAAMLTVAVTPSVLSIEDLFRAPHPNDAFNYRIGTGANYAAVSALAAHQGTGTFNGGNNKFGIWTALNKDSDPIRSVTGSGIGLPLTNVRMPNGWPPFTSGGEAAILVDMTTYLSHCFVNMTRSEDNTTRTAAIRRASDIRLPSHGDTLNFERRGTSASGVNNLKTLVRTADLFRTGYEIPYAIGLILPRGEPAHQTPDVIGKSIQLPAGWVDYNAADANRNTGPLAYGARLAIPPSYNYVAAINGMGVSAAAKEAAIRFFRQLAVYGCIVVDGGTQPSFRIDTRDVVDELGMNEATVISLYNEMNTVIRALLWQNLKLVTNAIIGATAQVNPGGGFTGSAGTLTNPVGGGAPLGYGDVC